MRKTIEKTWVFAPKGNEDQIKKLADDVGLTILQTSILYNRGFDTKDKIKYHLEFSLDSLHDTRLMKDAEKAVDIIINYCKHIWDATEKGQTPDFEITNYSDYDPDGVGSLLTFYYGFGKIGVPINTFQNDASMGYGITKEGVDKVLKKYPKTKLIITSDNGIVAFDAIEYAKSLGLDVIVTDHHEPESDGSLPNADAVVNPKRLDCPYPFKGLCGAGVVFKLMMLLYYKLGKNPKMAYELLDFVAIATVADVMDLIDENRAIVKAGLDLIKEEKRIVWKAMRETFINGFYERDITAKTIAFTYAPAINACRRMLGSMDIPVGLFTLPNEESYYGRMIEICEYLRDINDDRKMMTTFLADGIEAIWRKKDDLKVGVLYHESMKEGLAGLVAGRIKETYNRPIFVLAPDEENENLCRGSARSIPGFNLKEVLDEIQAETNLLVKYGGHALAAGLTLEVKNIEAFEKAINEKADKLLTNDDFMKYLYIDYAFDEDALDISVLDEIKFLEPYGQGFKEPNIGLRAFKPNKKSFLGDEKQHVQFLGKKINIVSWNASEECKIEAPFYIWSVGHLEYDAFNNCLKLAVEPEDIINKVKK